MKKLILIFMLVLGFLNISFASETTGTIETGVSTSGLEFNLPCNPASVSNGTVNSQTCAITCNSGYNLSGASCVAQLPSSSGGGGGGGGGGPSTCLDTQLECKAYLNTYVWQIKPLVYCTGGKLAQTCIPSSTGTGTTSTGSTSGSSSSSSGGSSSGSSSSGGSGTTGGSIGIETSSGKTTFSGCGLSQRQYSVEINELKVVTINKNDGKKIIIRDIYDSFAKGYIEKLAGWGVIAGYSDNTFRPNNTTSRAEYLKMVLLANCIDYSNVDTSKLKFKDVDKSSWIAKVVAKAVELKIIDGNNEYFKPIDNISRDESMKMLVVASGFKVDEESVSSFDDVSGWAVKYIETSKKLGIVDGQMIYGKLMFRPADNISRAEVAKIIIKVIELKK